MSSTAAALPTVQEHGVLLVLDADLQVVVCSDSSTARFGLAPAEVLGRPVAALLGTDVAARIAAARDAGPDPEPMVVVPARPGAGDPADLGDLGAGPVEVRVHQSGPSTVVELEPTVVGGSAPSSYGSVRSATTRLAAAGSLGELTELLADEVRELTGFDRVMVVRYDASWGAEAIAESRRDDLHAHLGRVFRDVEGASARRHTRPYAAVQVVADVAAAPAALVTLADVTGGAPVPAPGLGAASLLSASPEHLALLSSAGVTASMTLAVMIDDQLWGLITGHHYSGPYRVGHEVRASAEFFTQVASHLIAHRERADAREGAARTRAELSQMTARLTAATGGVLDAVFADPGVLRVFGATGSANLFEGELRTQGVVPDLETMLAISEALNEPDGYASSTDHLAGLDERFAPLADVADGVLRVGTLAERWGLWFRTDGSRWQPWHIEAAEDLGRHVNSLLLLRSREQVAMAESMQRSVVLDRAPDLPGIDLVARYRPATSYQLGGDWWDAFELDERRLVVVIGDAAGHGVAAASAMTQARTALRAYLYEGHGPAESLDRLDLLMDGLLGIGVATALVAVIDRETGEVEVASAGHPDPILVDRDGTAREVALERRPLLGVGLGQAPVSRIDLSDGGLLLFFTDGLVERRGADNDVQTARLIDLASGALEPHPHDDPAGWADRLLAMLDTPDDDTTLLAVRWA